MKCPHILFFLLLLTSINLQSQEASDPLAILSMIEEEDTVQALEALTQYQSSRPNDPWGYYLQGHLFLAQKAYKNALDAFEKGIKHQKRFAYNHIGAAIACHHLSNDYQRDRYIGYAKKYAKGDMEIALVMADAFLQMGLHDEAKILLYQLRELAPKDGRVWGKIGGCVYGKGYEEMAAEAYEKADSLGVISHQDKYHLAEIYRKKGQYKLAEKHYREILAKNPDYAPAHKGIGELWLRAKNYPKARASYERYLAALPHDPKARMRYASICYLAGDYQRCLSEMKAVDTTSLVKRRLTAYCQLELGQIEEAYEGMVTFFQTTQARSIISQDHEVMGRIFLKKGQDSLAVIQFEQMMDLDKAEEFQDYYQQLARRFKEGKAYKREAFFRKKALEHLPHPTTKDYYFYGISARKAALFPQAQWAYQQAIRGDSTFANAHFWLGYVVEKMAENDSSLSGQTHYQNAWNLLSVLPNEDLSDMQRFCLKNSGLYLVFKEWEQQQALGCDAILSYIQRLFTLDPALADTAEGEDLRKMSAYCEG